MFGGGRSTPAPPIIAVPALLALAAEGEAEDARAGTADGRALSPAEAARSNDALERRDRYRALALGSFGVSAVAGVTGTLLFVFDNPVPGPPPRERGTSYVLRYRGAF